MFRSGKKSTALAMVSAVVLTCLTLAKAATPTGILWQTNLEDAKRIASQTNRLLLVHFWSPSCVACQQLEKTVFVQPQVQQEIQSRFVPIKLNADEFPTTAKQYGITRLPTDLIVTPGGQIAGRMLSPLTAEAYLQQLSIAASGAAPVASQPAAGYPAAAPAVSAWMPAPGAVATGSGVSATYPVSASAPGAYAPAGAAPNPGVRYGAVSQSTNPSAGSAAPAVSAYSDSRYAEYFQRYSSAAGGNPAVPAENMTAATGAPQTYVAPTVNAGVPPTIMPSAAATQPNYAAPGYSPYVAPAYANPAAPTANPYLSGRAVGVPVAPATMAPQMAPSTMPYQTAPAAVPWGAGSSNATTPPPLGLDGFSPVTLVDEQRWQMGDRRWGVIHRGRTYLFTGPEEQRKFLADPDHYSPAISGKDVVIALDYGQEVDGRRAMGVQYHNRVYLFSSDVSRRAFSQNPEKYATQALQAEKPTGTTLR